MALAASVALLVGWHFLTGDALQLAVAHRFISAALPARLTEFVLGVLVAQMVVSGRRMPVGLLALGLAAPFLLTRLLPAAIAQGSYGLAFASLILLSCQTEKLQRALEFRPLLTLGIASYSVYLVHEPFMQIADILAGQLLPPLVVLLLSTAIGIGVGTIFYRLVERPMQSRGFRQRTVTPLARLLTPLDRATRREPAPHLLARDPIPLQ